MRIPESSKPQTIERRLLQGLLPLEGDGIDVGSGPGEFPDAVRQWWKLVPGMTTARVREWDKPDGDAADLATIADGTFDWLYSSHCLEHLDWPSTALINWVRVVRPGGRLLISVPHRQLYEQKRRPPSAWNHDHRWFWLPYERDDPQTIGAYQWLRDAREAFGIPFRILSIQTGDWGHTNTGTGNHPDGEYQIDILLERTDDALL